MRRFQILSLLFVLGVLFFCFQFLPTSELRWGVEVEAEPPSEEEPNLFLAQQPPSTPLPIPTHPLSSETSSLSKYLMFSARYGQVSNSVLAFVNVSRIARQLGRRVVESRFGPENHFRQEYKLSDIYSEEAMHRCGVVLESEFLDAHPGLKVTQLCPAIDCDGDYYGLLNVPVIDSQKMHAQHIQHVRDGSAPFFYEEELLSELSREQGEVLALGHFFGALGWTYPAPRLPGECDALYPKEQFVEAAKDTLQSLLPEPFVCMHWRRGDYEWFCRYESNQNRRDGCYPKDLNGVSEQLRQFKEANGAKMVFIATDGPQEERNFFRETLGAKFYENHRFSNNPIGDPLVEKIVCAHSVAFLGNQHSTFSWDIQRMRHWFSNKPEAVDWLI